MWSAGMKSGVNRLIFSNNNKKSIDTVSNITPDIKLLTTRQHLKPVIWRVIIFFFKFAQKCVSEWDNSIYNQAGLFVVSTDLSVCQLSKTDLI